MPQVIVNSDELRRFAHHLKQFNEQLKQNISKLNGEFSRLGDTWRDQEHQKFAQEYQQTMRVIERFLQAADQHIPFLLKKADIADKFSQR